MKLPPTTVFSSSWKRTKTAYFVSGCISGFLHLSRWNRNIPIRVSSKNVTPSWASENRVPGNINISIKGANGEMLLHRLDLKGISVSTGSACDSVNTQISHVIKAIGVSAEYAEGTIRVSLGRDNTETDAVVIAEALVQILTG